MPDETQPPAEGGATTEGNPKTKGDFSTTPPPLRPKDKGDFNATPAPADHTGNRP